MRLLHLKPLLLITLLIPLFTVQAKKNEAGEQAMRYIKALSVPEQGIGGREGGTKEEVLAGDFVKSEFEKMGLLVSEHHFSWPVLKKKGMELHSRNLIAEKKGKSDKVIVLGAHYDSTAKDKGSHGAMDNGAGTSVMLAVASAISKMSDLPYTVQFMAFGAEELGKIGSRAYVRDLQENSPAEVEKILLMVNLDTVAGGDYLYVHSAHTTPYKCGGNSSQYSSDPAIRKALLKASINMLGEGNAHRIHPEFPGYPEGVTGEWSDHEPFACAGIPIGYIETTNFKIHGKDGYDGYSQTVTPGLWDCFDAEKVGACDRETETKWGRIWHTPNDQLALLESLYPGRIESQIMANTKVLVEFFSKTDEYLK